MYPSQLQKTSCFICTLSHSPDYFEAKSSFGIEEPIKEHFYRFFSIYLKKRFLKTIIPNIKYLVSIWILPVIHEYFFVGLLESGSKYQNVEACLYYVIFYRICRD